MLTQTANEDLPLSHKRLSFWLRVREFAVPPSMIEAATASRRSGDWAGACAAANVDVDLDLRVLARTHGQHLAARIRSDLRHLAPDLLRWHMPRVAPDGLLRPGLTITLARYRAEGGGDGQGNVPLQLVVRTPPAWADYGQRISLALWDESRLGAGTSRHPHPRPNRRFRLDLHRHLWDARRSDDFRQRSGADGPPSQGRPDQGLPALLTASQGLRCAVDRWTDEAGILLRDEGRTAGTGTVSVRLGTRRRLALELVRGSADLADPVLRTAATAMDVGGSALQPVLPDAATWVPPDLDLLRTGAIEVDRLHPLVAAALAPGSPLTASPRTPVPVGQPRLVECRGAQHRIGMVNGVLTPLDHHPDEIRREDLLVALTGTPLPCLQAIDGAHRQPTSLADIRARLDHGDTAGALAAVEGLLGPDALLRSGPLRDELEAAAQQRITYGLFRAGLAGRAPDRLPPAPHRPGTLRSHPRHATTITR